MEEERPGDRGQRFCRGQPGAGPGAAWLEAFCDITGFDTRLSAEAARAGSLRLFYSSEKARRDLGLEPLPFRRAVEEAVAWYRREGFL